MKVAFCFLLTGPLHHEWLWREFFAGSQGRASIYAHCDKAASLGWVERFRTNRSVRTTWGNSMRAEIEMFREALRDEDNYKMLVLSESCVPLRTFDAVFSSCVRSGRSRMPFERACRQNYADSLRALCAPDSSFSRHYWINSQWVCMNRKHAAMMVADRGVIELVSSKLTDNEQYPATFLSLSGCLDEVENRPLTGVDWLRRSNGGKSPHVFRSLTESDAAWLLQCVRAGLLFARKFAPTCDVVPVWNLACELGDKEWNDEHA